jgi:short-chain fatty acids transporter
MANDEQGVLQEVAVAIERDQDEGRHRWVETLSSVVERLIPDAITTSMIMMVGLFALALAIGTSFTKTLGAYYDGLWMFLGLTMQMTLVLVLSLMLGTTPFFVKLIAAVARVPKTTVQVITMSTLCGALVSYLHWGLGIALGPVIAIYFCREAERKKIPVDFLWLLGVQGGVGSVWQFGLMASAPLLMNTPGHFLEKTTGAMAPSTTIFSPAALIFVSCFIVACVIVGCAFMPKKVRPISGYAESNQVGNPASQSSPQLEPPPDTLFFAQRLERSSWVMLPLVLMLVGWLYYHLIVLKQSLFTINSANTLVLLLCVVLHRNVFRFTHALRDAVALAWPLVLLYHLYAGVAGLIQFTPVGEYLATLISPISTRYTFPLLTTVISAVISFFIPSSGGQWTIQGFVTVKAAEAAGVSAQRGLLALSVGDHIGNLVTPFWAMVGAHIARVEFRQIVGYRMIFAALWFVMGVAAFTFLPC